MNLNCRMRIMRRYRFQIGLSQLGQEVVDAFYLIDPYGEKLTDPHALEAVEIAVLVND